MKLPFWGVISKQGVCKFFSSLLGFMHNGLCQGGSNVAKLNYFNSRAREIDSHSAQANLHVKKKKKTKMNEINHVAILRASRESQ